MLHFGFQFMKLTRNTMISKNCFHFETKKNEPNIIFCANPALG